MTDRLFAFNQRMTPHNDFFQDVEQALALGYAGVGLDEVKLPAGLDAAAAELMEASGLAATYVTPDVWPITPSPLDLPEHPKEVGARVEAICASIVRLSRFSPLGVIVGGGRTGDGDHPAGFPEEIAEPLAQIAAVAASHGMSVALEVMPARRGSAIPDVPTAVALLDEIAAANLGLLIDVAHVWDADDRDAMLTEHASRVLYAQLNDVRETERTWADRLLPGDGLGQATAIASALRAGGYDGWWELEVFSDDGSFGTELVDSLWRLPHADLLRRGLSRMAAVLDRPQGGVA